MCPTAFVRPLLIGFAAFGLLSACRAAPPAPVETEAQAPVETAQVYSFDEGSQVRFTGNKNKGVAAPDDPGVDVAGFFPTLTGDIRIDPNKLSDLSGTLTVDFSGLNTDLEARDINIRTHFFGIEEAANRTATYTIKAFKPEQEAIADGAVIGGTLSGDLRYRAGGANVELKVKVERQGNILIVRSTDSFQIQVGDWNLVAAHAKLKEVCGHTSLAESFPVTFELRMKPKS